MLSVINSLADDWPATANFLEIFCYFFAFRLVNFVLQYIRILTGVKEKSEKSPNCVLSAFFEGATGFLVQFVICITWRPVSTVENKRNRF